MPLPGLVPPPLSTPSRTGLGGGGTWGGTRSPRRRYRGLAPNGEEGGRGLPCPVDRMCSLHISAHSYHPSWDKQVALDKATLSTNCVSSSVVTDAPRVLSLIGCTGPPALPGIPRTRRARLLEWDRRTIGGQPPARPPPGHSRACAPPRLPLEPCGPGGPEGGGAGLTGVSRDRHAAAPAWLLPRRRRQRSGRVAPARNRQRRHASSSATIHGPRAAGVGAAVRARAGYVGGHPETCGSLSLWPASGSAH